MEVRTDPRVKPAPVGAEVVVVIEKGVAEAAGFPNARLNPVVEGVEVVRLPNVSPVDAAAAEAGVLKENPVVGFCANKLDPKPSVEVVLVVAIVEAVGPKPPIANPVLAGVLVAAPSENAPPVLVDPRVLAPKLNDILDCSFRNEILRTERIRPRGGP